MTQLTEHFSLEEFVRSSKADELNIDNTAPDAIVEKLKITAAGFERVRQLLGQPIHLNSGYRCPELNHAVGGSQDSDHMKGLAGDMVCPEFGPPLAIATFLEQHKAEIGFSKMIMEHTWLHLSFPDAGVLPLYTVLTAHFHAGARTTYTTGLA